MKLLGLNIDSFDFIIVNNARETKKSWIFNEEGKKVIVPKVGSYYKNDCFYNLYSNFDEAKKFFNWFVDKEIKENQEHIALLQSLKTEFNSFLSVNEN